MIVQIQLWYQCCHSKFK